MYEQTARVLVRASPEAVYAVLLSAAAVARWRVPDDMTAEVLVWDPVEGGRFRVSLTYRDPARAGKTDGATDTYAGTFARLVPNALVVEELAFEADDAGLREPMRMSWALAEVPDGTEVTVRHEGIPDAVPAADNETGTRMALAALAAYVEHAG